MGRKPKTPNMTQEIQNQSGFNDTEEIKTEPNSDKFFINSENRESEDEQKKLIDEIKQAADNEQKEKRGRKKKEVLEEDKSRKEFSESTSVLGSLTIGLIIDRYFPDKPLSEYETQLLNSTSEKVFYKYAEYLKNYQEETALLAVLSFILVPRLLDKKKKEKTQKETETNSLDKV